MPRFANLSDDSLATICRCSRRLMRVGFGRLPWSEVSHHLAIEAKCALRGIPEEVLAV